MEKMGKANHMQNKGMGRITPPNSIKFDIMLGDRFVCTMTMALGLEHLKGYDGDRPIFEMPFSALYDYAESKRPSLKGKDYHIEFVTKKTSELWRH